MKGALNLSKLVAGLLLAAVGLRFAYGVSHLLFHTIVEVFTVAVSAGVFMLAWNSQRFVSRSFLPIVGAAYLFTGALDLVHALAYESMSVLPSGGANLATQFWIAARLVEFIPWPKACTRNAFVYEKNGI